MLSTAKSATLIIKLLRWMCIWYSIRISTKLYEAKYVEIVYGKGEDPPSLTGIITTIVTMILVFHLALLAIVSSAVSAGFLPPSTLRYVITESVVYVVMTVIISLWLANLVQTKRYFNYRKDGIRAIRAYKEILLWLLFPISASPIFFTT
ncbi:hypothetical protein TetV_116 [Tetraselmis virus 1]|uniref:Uncharacterized protein n=1 Tax=Tetraselmis virus 1 TaxID=2060617 RepID=A0A2P0VMS5_9VIRU|nr:hypothetical protein QJ968_gp116 [Tetraselmis virus 1]AUF82208.1 hypothetical protein TetV_116 [Tetraselmis virus 1]